MSEHTNDPLPWATDCDRRIRSSQLMMCQHGQVTGTLASPPEGYTHLTLWAPRSDDELQAVSS